MEYETIMKASDNSLDLPHNMASVSYQMVLSSVKGKILGQNNLIILK